MTENKNPLLDRVMIPGETFTLPSGAIFYNNGELSEDVTNGEITVNPMTALDEIVIKTPDLLFSGKAVEQIFKRCIPQVREPLQLLAKDVDFLLICLRKVSFGDSVEVTETHTCNNAKEHSYKLSVDYFIKKTKRIDPTTITSKYNIKLDNGQNVTLTPIKFKDYVDLMQQFDNENSTPDQIRDATIKTLCNTITSVDEIDDKKMIREWLNKIPASYIRQISDSIYETTDWGPTYEQPVICEDCGEEFTATAPLNPIAFFI